MDSQMDLNSIWPNPQGQFQVHEEKGLRKLRSLWLHNQLYKAAGDCGYSPWPQLAEMAYMTPGASVRSESVEKEPKEATAVV